MEERERKRVNEITVVFDKRKEKRETNGKEEGNIKERKRKERE